MNDRISAADYQNLIKTNTGGKAKYGNTKTPYKGRTYHSKAEAGWAFRLDSLQAHGAIRCWLPQCPKFALTKEGRPFTYTADFLIFLNNGQVLVADCKGFDTPNAKLKRALVKDAYGIHVITAWLDIQEHVERTQA